MNVKKLLEAMLFEFSAVLYEGHLCKQKQKYIGL